MLVCEVCVKFECGCEVDNDWYVFIYYDVFRVNVVVSDIKSVYVFDIFFDIFEVVVNIDGNVFGGMFFKVERIVLEVKIFDDFIFDDVIVILSDIWMWVVFE